jgi:hypothetical protein
VRSVALDGQAVDVAFDYRIVAKRLGYEEVRLAPAEDPEAAMAIDAKAPDRSDSVAVPEQADGQ